MKEWPGVAMIAVGVWLAGAALFRGRRRDAVTPVSESLAVFGEIMRPIIIGVLALAGVKMGLMYLAFGGDGLFSGFNLAGLEFLLAAYGGWIFVSLRPRRALAPAAEPVGAMPETERVRELEPTA